jgi:hypothetical protein
MRERNSYYATFKAIVGTHKTMQPRRPSTLQQQQRECDKGSTPPAPAGAKALVLNDTAVEVTFLPPNSTACFDAFVVSARDSGGGAAPPPQTVDGLSAVFTGLTPGATYEFAVRAQSAGRGAGPALTAPATLPPGLLDAKPGPPERFRAVATGEGSMQLSWDLPAGNPRVDGYAVRVLQTNETGYPLRGSGQSDQTLQAGAGQRGIAVTGLRPGAYWGFVIQSLSKKYGDSEPAFAFRASPRPGAARPPDAPGLLTADPAGNGTVVLSWRPPGGGAGGAPDLYVINITQIDPANGNAPISETNSIPYRNTTAVIDDLEDGATFRFTVQALSVAYDDGGSATIDYALPTPEALAAREQQYQQQQQQQPGQQNQYQQYQPGPRGGGGGGVPRPVEGLAAVPAGGDAARVTWRPPAGGPAPDQYLVQVSDQATGRPLGTSYMTPTPDIVLPSLPLGGPLEILVQVS